MCREDDRQGGKRPQNMKGERGREDIGEYGGRETWSLILRGSIYKYRVNK